MERFAFPRLGVQKKSTTSKRERSGPGQKILELELVSMILSRARAKDKLTSLSQTLVQIMHQSGGF